MVVASLSSALLCRLPCPCAVGMTQCLVWPVLVYEGDTDTLVNSTAAPDKPHDKMMTRGCLSLASIEFQR
jgi:hypothetical protein